VTSLSTPEAAVAAAAPVTRAGSGSRGHRLAPWLFLAPALTLFVLFLIVPIGYTLYLSFRRTVVSGLGLGAGSRREGFAGLHNYSNALANTEFWRGALRVLLYGGILVPLMLGLALLFALLLDTPTARFTRFARLAIFLPYAVPSVIGTVLWGFLYLPTVSPFGPLLDAVGLSMPNLLTPVGLYPALINIAVWGGTGFNMIVLYTSLRAVPSELYEAARIDGCSELQLALRIKIPMIRPALLMTGIFSVIATLQVFTEPMTLRPLSNALSSTWTPLMDIYHQAFTANDIYSAAAMSMILALATLALSFAFLRLLQRQAFGENRGTE
jgi:multiple sugar transport system permease protein